MVGVGHLCRTVLTIVMADVANQDLGQSIDLLHHMIDLAVFRAADRDVGQRPREEVAGWPQGPQQPVGDLPSQPRRDRLE